PPREADRERIEAERVPYLIDEFGALTALPGATCGAQPRHVDQLRFQRLARLPQLAVLDAVDGVPGRGFRTPVAPARTEMAVIEPVHLRGEPGAHVDAVGDVPDRH